VYRYTHTYLWKRLNAGVAECCNILQSVALCCRVLQGVAVLQLAERDKDLIQVLQRSATCYSVVQLVKSDQARPRVLVRAAVVIKRRKEEWGEKGMRNRKGGDGTGWGGGEESLLPKQTLQPKDGPHN